MERYVREEETMKRLGLNAISLHHCPFQARDIYNQSYSKEFCSLRRRPSNMIYRSQLLKLGRLLLPDQDLNSLHTCMDIMEFVSFR
jgi:hypothetical protein